MVVTHREHMAQQHSGVDPAAFPEGFCPGGCGIPDGGRRSIWTGRPLEVVESGFWCQNEGIFFTDESEIDGEEGHFGYPCGERGVGDEWLAHEVVRVAIVIWDEA